jgi:glycosyltransferase involved in cell wall biosynthesis
MAGRSESFSGDDQVRSDTPSVCLCTYNGGRYLKDLLVSLSAQTLLPAELLVGDDGSSDDTLEILRGFAAEAPFPVEISHSERRLGPAANLERLLVSATGDVVFPCDQDDIWNPAKIEVLARTLDERPSFGAAISNSALIDGEGRPLASSLFERAGLDAATREILISGSSAAMVEIARRNVVASHALAIRRGALDLVLPFGSDWQADWWIAIVLSAITGIAIVEDCLVEYRLHDLNTVGLREKLPLAERVSHERAARFSSRADLLHAAIARVSNLRPGVPNPADRAILEAQVAHLRIRGSLPTRRVPRLAAVLREARGGGYRRFSNGWRSALGDVVRAGD